MPPMAENAPSTAWATWVPVLSLPVDALRLAARHFVPLAQWFSAGAIARYLLIQGISHLGHGSHGGIRRALVLLPLSVTVLASLVVTIGMLFVLGRGLSVIDDPEERYAAAIGRALFPFVLIYLGWNLYTTDLREVLRADAQRLADAGDAMDAGNILDLPILVCLVAALVAWALRFLCERLNESALAGRSRPSLPPRAGSSPTRPLRSLVALAPPGRTLELLAAFFEVNFTLYGLYSIVQLARAGQHWLADRVFWHAVAGDLPGPGPVEDALILPLVWFAIAALVYGVEMGHREAIVGTPLEKVPGRLTGRRRRLAELTSRGPRDKYVPVVHAVRLVFRAGAPAVAWFCLCYVAIGALMDRVQRGVIFLVGTDHSVRFWNLVLVPVEFGHRLVYEVLRLALLAAMFDLATRRARPVSAGTPAEDRPAAATGPGADAP